MLPKLTTQYGRQIEFKICGGSPATKKIVFLFLIVLTVRQKFNLPKTLTISNG